MTCENRQSPQHNALALTEVVVAPVQHVAQRLVPARRGAAAASQDAEPIVEPRGQFGNAQRAGA